MPFQYSNSVVQFTDSRQPLFCLCEQSGTCSSSRCTSRSSHFCLCFYETLCL